MKLPWLGKVHAPLITMMAALACVGVISVYSATARGGGEYAWRQMIWCVMGFSIFLGMSYLNYRSLLSASFLLYGTALFMLVAVLLFGDVRQGARRWMELGPLAFQPSEFAKMATLLALAHYLGSVQPWENKNKATAMAVLIFGVPMLLIAKQPDLGTSLIFIPMALAVLFLWGIRYRYLLGALAAALISAPVLWAVLKDYQRKRILVFLNPQMDPLGAGYTALQSKIAVGSGGFWGKGFLHGTQSQLNFVPEHHTDFIFCVIGEEWGFIGVLILILLYVFLFRAVFSAIESTTDEKAKLLAAGVAAMLFAQVFVNIGMSIGLMPITGITLPLVSYGGSSFVATSFALGLIHSVYRQRTIF